MVASAAPPPLFTRANAHSRLLGHFSHPWHDRSADARLPSLGGLEGCRADHEWARGSGATAGGCSGVQRLFCVGRGPADAVGSRTTRRRPGQARPHPAPPGPNPTPAPNPIRRAREEACGGGRGVACGGRGGAGASGGSTRGRAVCSGRWRTGWHVTSVCCLRLANTRDASFASACLWPSLRPGRSARGAETAQRPRVAVVRYHPTNNQQRAAVSCAIVFVGGRVGAELRPAFRILPPRPTCWMLWDCMLYVASATSECQVDPGAPASSASHVLCGEQLVPTPSRGSDPVLRVKLSLQNGGVACRAGQQTLPPLCRSTLGRSAIPRWRGFDPSRAQCPAGRPTAEPATTSSTACPIHFGPVAGGPYWRSLGSAHAHTHTTVHCHPHTFSR